MKLLNNKYYICKVCNSINYAQNAYYESTACHCTKCNKQQPAKVINNELEEILAVKDNYKLTTGAIKNFSKHNMVIEKYSLEIDFSKAIEDLAKENLTSSQIAEILEKHMEIKKKKKNISLYEFRFDSSQEKEVDRIQLYKDGKKLKAVKSKLKTLLAKFSREDIIGKEMCEGFNYGYSYRDSYNYESLMELFKYPHIEILVKAGFTKLYYYDNNYNKKGTNPQEILQIPKSKCKFLKDFLEIRDKKEDEKTNEEMTYAIFGNYENYWAMFRYYPKLDLTMLKKTLNKIRSNCETLIYERSQGMNHIFSYNYNFTNTRPNINQIINLYSIAKENKIKFDVLIDYLTLTVREEQGIASPSLAFKIYEEMVRYTKELDTDLDKYPRNLITAHDKLAYQRVLNSDKINKQTFIERTELNKIYEYENDEYCMITPAEIEDLGKEGRRLSNCIGTYVDRYLSGQSKIYFMRAVNDRDKALIAVELNMHDVLIQERGYCNRNLTEEEDNFVKEWMKFIVNKKQEMIDEKLRSAV